MKKILTTFLIITYLTNIGGYLFFYLPCKDILKENARQNTSAGILKSKIEKIKISKFAVTTNSVNLRIIDEHEIIFNGHLYDVIKKEETKNLITYYCVADIQEDLLEKLIRNNFDDNNLNSHKKNIKILFKSLITDVFLESTNFLAILTYDNPFYRFKYLSFSFYTNEVLTPPPQFIS